MADNGEKSDDMVPTIIENTDQGWLGRPVRLAEDFDRWMEARRVLSWYRKSWGLNKSKVKQTEGKGCPQKLPDPSVCETTNPRRAFLISVTETRSLTPSSSNASIFSNHSFSTTTPPSSASPSPLTPVAATFASPICLTPTASLSSSSSSSTSPANINSTTTPSTPINLCSSERHVLFITEYFEVRRSRKGGFGAFATKDIEKETIVMTEKPLFRAAFANVFFQIENLTKEERQEYRTLHGWSGLTDTGDLAKFMTNRFETSAGKGGIFVKSSRFNHACHPYATCTYRYDEKSDTLIFTACNPIKKDDEITISYTTNPAQLMENYGFYCDCPACPSPKVAAKQAQRLRGPR